MELTSVTKAVIRIGSPQRVVPPSAVRYVRLYDFARSQSKARRRCDPFGKAALRSRATGVRLQAGDVTVSATASLIIPYEANQRG